MITSVEIENLRGIRHGKLEGLGPLTILTGPNGGGKSTVLDALLIGADQTTLGDAVARHATNVGGARWLFHRGATEAGIGLCADGFRVDLRLTLRGKVGEPRTVSAHAEVDDSQWDLSFTFQHDNSHELGGITGHSTGGKPPQHIAVRLVDSGITAPGHRLFSEVAKLGRRDDVNALLETLVSDFRHLEILTEDDEPVLHIATGWGSVPVSLAGDGIQAFVQVVLQIAIAPGGLVLLEEPEVYQHPRAIWRSAEALLANVRRGVQVVLTTHSLELIDALISKAGKKDLDKLVLFNMLLKDGELVSGRRQGEEISFARETLEKDLR